MRTINYLIESAFDPSIEFVVVVKSGHVSESPTYLHLLVVSAPKWNTFCGKSCRISFDAMVDGRSERIFCFALWNNPNHHQPYGYRKIRLPTPFSSTIIGGNEIRHGVDGGSDAERGHSTKVSIIIEMVQEHLN